MKKISLIMLFLIILFFILSKATLSIDVTKNITIEISDFTEQIPQEVWNKTFGGSNLDWGWSVQETTDGGFIIGGETVSFGSGGYDAWLIKTDNNGNETWNKTFGGSVKDGARSVQQTIDGGYIIGGYADSYGNPGHDVWLIKTDDEGNQEWDSIFGGLASDAAFSVFQTSDEGYIAVGYVDSYGAGDHDLWLIKTDMYGNEEWNMTYGGSDNDWGSGVVITDDGGYVITGDTRSFGPGGYDVWLIKTDSYGNELWRRIYGDPLSDDTGYSLKKTSDGGYIVSGTKTSFATELTDVWLIKTDDDGYMQWNLTLDGGEDDWSYSVDETIDGGYIITGLTNSFGNGDYDLWLIKVELVDYENQPPTSPEISGSQFGYVGVEYEYILVSDDFEGDGIFYLVDWGDETFTDWFGPFASGEDATVNHTWILEGDYNIKAKAKDINDNESNWSDPFLVRIGNNPPDKPDIDGPSRGKSNTEYDFTFNSTDPNGHDIAEYVVDWGDDSSEETISGPFESGEEATASHSWTAEKTFTIKAKAKDTYGAESNWSEFQVTITRNRIATNIWYQWLFKHLPLIEKLIHFLR